MNLPLSILLLSALPLLGAEIRSIQVIPAGEQTVLNLAVTTEDGNKTVKMPFSELPQEARGDWATLAMQANNPENKIVPEGGGLVQIVVEPRGKTSDFVSVTNKIMLTSMPPQEAEEIIQVPVEGTERMVFDFFWTVQRNGSMREVKASSESMPKPFRICCESLWNILYSWVNAKPAEPVELP